MGTTTMIITPTPMIMTMHTLTHTITPTLMHA